MSKPSTATHALADHQVIAEAHTFQILESIKTLKRLDTRDWGYAGSMAHVNELLAEAARITGELAAAARREA